VDLRDDAEQVLRSWNAYEIDRGADPVIDFDCYPTDVKAEPATARLAVHRQLGELLGRAERAQESSLAAVLQAHRTYLSALMGERLPLSQYVVATQGCPANGWPDDYVKARGDIARKSLDALGISWGPGLRDDLEQLCEPIEATDAPDLIREAARQYEPAVRRVTGTQARYELAIETADIDDYWAYWVDGAGQKVRLRLNLRNARFTAVEGRQFAMHEVLGHGLQGATYAARSAEESVPWIRLMSVHSVSQVLFEGLAQAMPLFIAPDDELLIACVRLAHYTQLVRAELHISINSGISVEECAAHATARVPWWTDQNIGDILSDRGANPRLRSYLWAYPAGLDWFAALAETDTSTVHRILQAAYHDPLSPLDLAALWPAGPPVGGVGDAHGVEGSGPQPSASQ
jgi:hypothetical protein